VATLLSISSWGLLGCDIMCCEDGGSMNHNTTWHHNPEDLNLKHHCCESLKTCNLLSCTSHIWYFYATIVLDWAGLCSGGTLGLYLEGTCSKSQLGYCYLDWDFSYFSSISSSECQYNTLKYAMTTFQKSCTFIVHWKTCIKEQILL